MAQSLELDAFGDPGALRCVAVVHELNRVPDTHVGREQLQRNGFDWRIPPSIEVDAVGALNVLKETNERFTRKPLDLHDFKIVVEYAAFRVLVFLVAKPLRFESCVAETQANECITYRIASQDGLSFLRKLQARSPRCFA